MLSQFVAKFTVESEYCISRNGVLAIENFAPLREGIIDLASREAASLFAEPIITAKGDLIDVAYYGEPVGGAVSIDRLDDAARGVVIEKLKARLAALAPLLASKLGPLLADALYINSPEDVLAVGSEPLLVRWGMLPAGIRPSDPSALDAHFAATLGRYAPFGAPRLGSARRPPPNTASPANSLPAVPPPAVGAPARDWSRESRGLVIATGIAAFVTLLLSLPGFLDAPVGASGADADLLPAARQISQAMKDKLDQARKALTTVVCNPDGSIAPAPNDGQQGQMPPAPIPITPASGNAQGDLALVARRASESVVLLMNCTDRKSWDAEHAADKEKGSPIACPRADAAAASPESDDLVLDSSGSGFFIAPKLVATNTHVVAGAKRMFASSTFLGRVVPGKVEAATVKVEISDPDFAVVSLDIDVSPPPIPLATTVSRLQNVVAAGFPGIVMVAEQFEQLFKGNFAAMPELTTYPGFVTLTKDRTPVPLIFSSAAIGHGNSGGPLLDLCARAVGVNTLGGSGHDDETSYQINIAEGSTALAAFLDQHNIAHQTVTDSCGAGPQAAAPPTGTPPPKPAAAPPGPAPAPASDPAR